MQGTRQITIADQIEKILASRTGHCWLKKPDNTLLQAVYEYFYAIGDMEMKREGDIQVGFRNYNGLVFRFTLEALERMELRHWPRKVIPAGRDVIVDGQYLMQIREVMIDPDTEELMYDLVGGVGWFKSNRIETVS